ncbi:LLM class flavin-dependent oxidoreductase [Nocardia mikamii]|uniref:LLM class flavin-dependent oxidoreductase n=1 Tax=Nocardia mikamii TaxID=508464 RepID=UPI000A03011E|nr:LLM class flavin-dependent oxidoreductase [Nocardia mikamii]
MSTVAFLIDIATGSAQDAAAASSGAARSGSGALTSKTDVGEMIPITAAARIAATAQEAGVIALRILDSADGRRALDPGVAAAYLAGRAGGIGYLVDLATTHNPPYNVARRVLSFDRATGGRAGVVLRPGEGDDVSDAVVAPSPALTPGQRWEEYTEILTRLWESFPRAALLGDQEGARVADPALIAGIDYEGRGYRVAGPLDGPSSVQGRPLVVAADTDLVGWDIAARSADAVIVAGAAVPGAGRALTAALERVGRRRGDVVLIGRAPVTVRDRHEGRAALSRLVDWAHAYDLDAVELSPTGGARGVLAAAEAVATLPAAPPGPTLRSALGLPSVAAVLR